MMIQMLKTTVPAAIQISSQKEMEAAEEYIVEGKYVLFVSDHETTRKLWEGDLEAYGYVRIFQNSLCSVWIPDQPTAGVEPALPPNS